MHSNPYDSEVELSMWTSTSRTSAGLPGSGKNIWKMNFFQVREKSGSKFFPLRVNPKSEVIQFTPLKNKNDFFICQRVWKTVKMSGKNQGILRWMISGNPAVAYKLPY